MGLAGKLAQPEPAPPPESDGRLPTAAGQPQAQAQAQPYYPTVYSAGEGAQEPPQQPPAAQHHREQQQQRPPPPAVGLPVQQFQPYHEPLPGPYHAQGQPQAYYTPPQRLVLAPPSQEALIRNKLLAVYQQNQLASFHVPQSIEVLAGELARRDAYELGAAWGLPLESALDLTALALYDTMVLCDDSAAMRSEDGGERARQLRAVLERLAAACGRLGCGVTLLAANSGLRRDGVCTAADASDFVDLLSFEGGCALGGALQQRVLQPHYYQPMAVGQLRRPLHVVVLTGSAPSGEPPQQLRTAVQQAIRHFKASRTGPRAIAFQIAQVGQDEAARVFLAELAGRKISRTVDCTLPCEREQELLARICVNAITRSFPEQDGAQKRGFLDRLFK